MTRPAAWLCVGLFLVALGAAPRARRSGAGGWIALAASVVAGALGLFMLFGLLAFASDAGLLLPVLSPLLALPLAISAFWWMAAPTREGRAVMDKIAGFHRYLSITEENRLEVLHPPEKTPELFERFLPLCDRARRREQMGGQVRLGARRGRGRPEPPGRHLYGLVCRQPDALDRPRPLRRLDGRRAGEQRRLGRDRAGIEQRLGRRRLFRRRRRRRRRRRLVAAPAAFAFAVPGWILRDSANIERIAPNEGE